MSNLPTPIVPSTSFLVDLLSVKARRAVYTAYGFVGLALGATVATYVYMMTNQDGVEFPVWLGVALTLYGFLTPFFTGLATANATAVGEELDRILEEDGDDLE